MSSEAQSSFPHVVVVCMNESFGGEGQGMAPSSEPHEAQFADQNDDYVRDWNATGAKPNYIFILDFYLPPK